jgi:hypothetical protein
MVYAGDDRKTALRWGGEAPTDRAASASAAAAAANSRVVLVITYLPASFLPPG